MRRLSFPRSLGRESAFLVTPIYGIGHHDALSGSGCGVPEELVTASG